MIPANHQHIIGIQDSDMENFELKFRTRVVYLSGGRQFEGKIVNGHHHAEGFYWVTCFHKEFGVPQEHTVYVSDIVKIVRQA